MTSDFRATKSGLAKDIAETIDKKFDNAEAAKTLRWIKSIPIPEGLPQHICDAANAIPDDIQTVDKNQFRDYLKDGLAFGHLMASLDPAQIEKMKTKIWTIATSPQFENVRQRERVAQFNEFCKTYGVRTDSLFQSEQLQESTNLWQVVLCLSQLGCEAQSKPGYQGPKDMWTKKHKENRREFTEEKLKSGESVVGLQMGSTAGATASGISFGARRHITDSH